MLLSVGSGVIAAGVYSLVAEPTYYAQATIEFSDANRDLEVIGTDPLDLALPKDSVQKARQIRQPATARRVRRALGTRLSASQLLALINTRVRPSSDLVTIRAESRDPRLAADLANAFAVDALSRATRRERRRFDVAVRELRRELRDSDSPARRMAYREQIDRLESLGIVAEPVRLVENARVPTGRSSPKPARDLLVGGLIGLLVGAAAAFGRALADHRLQGPAEIEAQYRLPLIGSLAECALGVERGERGLNQGDLETLRRLRTHVDLSVSAGACPVIAVTSACPQEGKSTVAAGFARVAALSGRKVLLIECDLHRPVLARGLGIEKAPGLSECLAHGIDTAEAAQVVRTSGPGDLGGPGSFSCVTAGTPTSNPSALLGSPQFAKLLTEASSEHELVILDTPPLLSVSDTRELLPLASGAVVCARIERLTTTEATAARGALERLGQRPAWLIITGTRDQRDGDLTALASPAPARNGKAAAGLAGRP